MSGGICAEVGGLCVFKGLQISATTYLSFLQQHYYYLGGMNSRFVSQKELDSQSKGKGEGEGEYDSRSLYERLQADKEEKDAKYHEMYKLSNQFRGIDQAESEFLASIKDQKQQQELERRQREREELESFRSAKQETKIITATPKPITPAPGAHEKSKSKKRKSSSSSLLGVVKKKPSTTTTTMTTKNDHSSQPSQDPTSKVSRKT